MASYSFSCQKPAGASLRNSVGVAYYLI